MTHFQRKEGTSPAYLHIMQAQKGWFSLRVAPTKKTVRQRETVAR